MHTGAQDIPKNSRAQGNAAPSIPPEEYRQRIGRVQEKMKETGMDVILTFSHAGEPGYARYFADFQPSFETAGVAIPQNGAAALLAGPEGRERALLNDKLGCIKRMLAYREPATPKYEDDSFDTFAALLAEYNAQVPIHTLGIGGWNMIPMDIFEEIRASLAALRPNAKIVPADGLLAAVSEVKSDAEIGCIREACRITRLAMDSVMDALVPGVTGEQLKGIALAKMYAEGAEGEGFSGWVTCGEETALPIGICSKRAIQAGDLVQIQIGARVNGYASVIGRPVVLGKASAAQKELLTACIAAKNAVEQALKGGGDSEEVAAAHRQALQKMGKESWMAYGPCHSLGMVECEAPWIESGVSFPLQKNMVFCTDIFLQDEKNHLGARYEDVLLVTQNGREQLTAYPAPIFEKSVSPGE